jgi:chemotaxis signal transduction protein
MHYYLSFMIKDVSFAVPIEEVQEIARPKTMLIKEKSNIKNMIGHFNLRGVRIPLFNLSAHLALDHDDNHEVIIISHKDIMIGVRVDVVRGIVAARDIIPYPDMIPKRTFLMGIIPDEKALLQVISLMKIFTGKRVQAIKTYLEKQTV